MTVIENEEEEDVDQLEATAAGPSNGAEPFGRADDSNSDLSDTSCEFCWAYSRIDDIIAVAAGRDCDS